VGLLGEREDGTAICQSVRRRVKPARRGSAAVTVAVRGCRGASGGAQAHALPLSHILARGAAGAASKAAARKVAPKGCALDTQRDLPRHASMPTPRSPMPFGGTLFDEMEQTTP